MQSKSGKPDALTASRMVLKRAVFDAAESWSFRLGEGWRELCVCLWGWPRSDEDDTLLVWYGGVFSGALCVELNGEGTERLEAPLLERPLLLRWVGYVWSDLLC